MKCNLALSLTGKYGTSTPVELAEKMGIRLVYEPLGKVKMYHTTTNHTGIIHINSLIPWYAQPFYIGIALYHHLENTDGFRVWIKKPLNQFTDFERSAVRFSLTLTFYDDLIRGNDTVEGICQQIGMSMEEIRQFMRWLMVVYEEYEIPVNNKTETMILFLTKLSKRG